LKLAWTKGAVLPGGEIGLDFDAALSEFSATHADIPAKTAWRLLRNYGSHAYDIAANRGEDLGSGVSQGEIEYLKNREYAVALDDILWRRSKLGLVVSDQTKQRITDVLGA